MRKGQNKKGSVKRQLVLLACVTVVLLFVLTVVLLNFHPAILNPSGVISSRQRELIILAVALGSIVTVPVFVMLFAIAWRYHEGNTNAKYSPDWQGNRLIEGLWWGIPLLIITILGVVAWQTSHELDPFRSLDSDKKPVKIQVVALQWRWLFIYPEQHVATINELRMPVDTPVNFEITADAPMNSFWIPKLGSQVYAMPGMSTQLHLQGSQIGTYYGSSANISGSGFANMRFAAHVVTADDFAKWANATQHSTQRLDSTIYSKIANPTKDTVVYSYALSEPSLYDTIVEKYMGNMEAHY